MADLDVRLDFQRGDLAAAVDPALPLHLLAEPDAEWWQAGIVACLETCAHKLLDASLDGRRASAVVAAVHDWARALYAARRAKALHLAPLRLVVGQHEERLIVSGDFFDHRDEHLERALDRVVGMLGRPDLCFRECVWILRHVRRVYIKPAEQRPALTRLVRELRRRAPRVAGVEAALAVLDPDGPPSTLQPPEPRWRGRDW